MSLPREPRQKMINMMYLVLTALLALNVSAEILNAFKTVNKSLETTNATVGNSTETIMKSLVEKQTDPKTAVRARIWLPKAQSVQRLTGNIYSYIQGIKDIIIQKGGGDPYSTKFKADNLDIATRLMLDQGKAKELKQKLDDYKVEVLKALLDNTGIPDSVKVDTSGYATLTKSVSINTEIPKTQSSSNRTFERAYFHMVPTVAALTILSKFQNDIKTSENKMVEFCHNKVGEVVVRFDTYTAFAATNSSYIMPGDDMEITAGVGAFSKAALPVINVDGVNVPLGDDGTAHQKMKASTALGKHNVTVLIKYKDLDGQDQTATKNIEYTVGQSSASIALTKMNVLYIGVDNPVSITATGGGSEKLVATMTGTGGSLINNHDGTFTAKPTNVTDDCWINVTIDGKSAGKRPFRVRTIPTPVATIGGVAQESMTVGQMKAQSGLGAYIKDFPFELQYRVVSYTFSLDNDDGLMEEIPVQGYNFTPQVQKLLNTNLKAGRIVSIDNIYAVGPDGVRKKLPGLTYYIK